MKRILLILLVVLAGTAFTQNYEFYNKKLTAEQKEQAIYLEKNIMATCCFGGPIYMHGKNRVTEEAKITIRRLIIEGKTTDQVLDHFRNSIDPRTGKPFGNRILASPKASETVGQVSYWMVVGFAVIGLALLALAIKKLAVQKDKPAATGEISKETRQQIESELSDLS
ncbi:MAG: cytochrome c-type biogenesis protein CcmH [Candidatus Marinimicrobia bacterium]|nr:cytochrome c-type biogenesis protein CcmH [Candidatus Neomarinimicrobiota bacterium]